MNGVVKIKCVRAMSDMDFFRNLPLRVFIGSRTPMVMPRRARMRLEIGHVFLEVTYQVDTLTYFLVSPIYYNTKGAV